MAKKLGSNHYLAVTPQPSLINGYWTDGAESHRTDRSAASQNHYIHTTPRSHYSKRRRGKSMDNLHTHRSSPDVRPHSSRSGHMHPSNPDLRMSRSGHLHHPSVHDLRPHSSRSHRSRTRDDDSDIYVTNAVYHGAPSQISQGSRRLVSPSEMSVKSKVSRKGGVVVETMSAPNPFCPNTRGCCCLLLLINLGIILVTLGFVIVLQFYEPAFVWILGIIFLIFGFIAVIVSLVYCVTVCKDAKTPRQVAEQDHYWTRHWQKNFGLPEIHYTGEKTHPMEHDRYSESEPYSVNRDRQRY